MTERRRIFWNIVATYGRSLFALGCGLFSGRWTLAALGVEAYGVYGVVGAIMGLVTLLNSVLSVSVSRHYAYAIGFASVAEDKAAALRDCREWFTVALVVHTLLPAALVCAGYPLGLWALRHYFVIPPALLETSEWVFRFALCSTFVGMVSVPFNAMYTAKQYIAELTIYGFFTSLLYVFLAHWLLTYGGDRLLLHALCSMLLSVVPAAIIILRACLIFPECRIAPGAIVRPEKVVAIFSFAGWQLVGWFGSVFRTQGCPIFINKVLGLEYNSTMAVANTVSSHASTLSGALTGAFTPAVTNAAGAGNTAKSEHLALQTSKFGTLLCALFVLPLSLEIDYIIQLWLKEPPPQVAGMCLWMMWGLIVDRMTGGILTLILARGNIRLHEILNGCCLASTLAFAWFFTCICHQGILGVGQAYMAGIILFDLMRLALAKWQLKMALRAWICRFILPFGAVALLILTAGWTFRLLFQPGFLRLVVVSMLVVGLFIGAAFCWILDREERDFLLGKLWTFFSDR